MPSFIPFFLTFDFRHPSLLGHELRAAHYVYFWLLIYKEAISEILANFDTLPTLTARVQKHSSAEHRHLPAKPLHESDFIDHMQCYTTFEPRQDPGSHLLDLRVPDDSSKKWKVDIMEQLMDPGIITKARSQGYKDFKYMIFGNKDAGPLSLKINVRTKGTGSLCQPPGNWGKLPDGFVRFFEVDTKVYITENVEDPDKFVFAVDKAKQLPYTNRNIKDTQTVCVHFNDMLSPGKHVLTIVPSTSENVAFTYLLIP